MPVTSEIIYAVEMKQFATATPSELAAPVAADAIATTADVGVQAGEAALEVEAVIEAGAAEGTLGTLEMLGSCSSIAGILVAAGLILLDEMAKPEAVTIVIENKTDVEWKQDGLHVHHGKRTIIPQKNGNETPIIPPRTDEMANEEKAVFATYGYSKDNMALFGTEGVLQLTSNEDDNSKISIGWYIPETGNNGCRISLHHDIGGAKAAWKSLIDNKDHELTDMVSNGSYDLFVRMDKRSGGDVTMIVSIRESA
tara:strand:- start:2576 stop:3337 length:762 start_codon:yes stop_codon:yes gene_type:complete